MFLSFGDAIKFISVYSLLTLFMFYMKHVFNRRNMYIAAAKIKGPFAFPLIGAAYDCVGLESTEEFLKMLMNNFEKYGSTVKLWAGPYLLICCRKPEDMEIIMNSTKCVEKSMFYNHMKPFGPNGIGIARGQTWKTNRKVLRSLLSHNLVESFFEKMYAGAEKMIPTINKILQNEESGTETRLSTPIERSLLELVCATLFGIKPQTHFLQRMHDFLHEYTAFISSLLIKFWTYIDPIFHLTKLAKNRNKMVLEYRSLIDEVISMKRLSIKEKGTQLQNPKPFLESLMEINKFTDEQLFNEISHFLTAGIDTTSTTINYMLMCLGIFPEIQNKVYEELMFVLEPNKKISNEDLQQLEYLERVMFETLRIFPVAPDVSREVTEDIKISDNLTLPAGATLVLSIFGTQMDPNHWPEPWQFNPDRFLPENVANRHPYAYLAFGGGIRNCIGYKYAKMNIKTYVAAILREFRVECDYKTVQEVRQEIRVVNMPVLGYKFRLYRR